MFAKLGAIVTHRTPRARLASRLVSVACRTAVAALALVSVGCIDDSDAVDDGGDAITIGLLLPFTGSESATASNFERAALFARDQVNAAGGVKGHRLRLLSVDTHSNVERAKESVDSLIAAGAVIVIGPESAEIAAAVKPILDKVDVVFMSPFVGASDDKTVDCTKPWFRLAPSASVFGEALAKQAITDGYHRAGTFHSGGAYDEALHKAFANRFTALKGEVVFQATMAPTAQSYATTLGHALDAGAETMLLAASPRSAALAVNELGALTGHRPPWLLSPLLKTDLLLQNVAPEVLEGSVGVTPTIFDDTNKFPTEFAERWSGDRPLEGAYFYYDALALSAFAIEKAALVDGELLPSEVRNAVFKVTGSVGEAGSWEAIGDALERIRKLNRANSPTIVFYKGVTGPMLLKRCGDRNFGKYTRWEVHDGEIQDLTQ